MEEELHTIKHDPEKVILKHYPDAAEIYKTKGWKFPTSVDRVYVTEKAKIYLGYHPVYTFEHLLYNKE